ncbi:MAG: hypothetical protein ACSHYB_03635 [Roseibacillus sp.]
MEVNVCDECNGFSVLLKQEAANALEAQLNKHFSKGGEGNVVATLVSPYTGEPMKRFVYREIQLDYCPATHSIWFDYGEYSRMFQGPEKVAARPTKSVSEAGGKAWETVENVGNSIDVLGVVGEVIGELLTGVDIFS